VTDLAAGLSRLTEEQKALVASASDQVELIARRMAPRLRAYFELHELVALGHLGLIEAAQSYDATLGVPFSGYATFRVRGAMLDAAKKEAGQAKVLLLAARSAGCEYASMIPAAGNVLTEGEDESRARLRAMSDGIVASMFAALAGAHPHASADEAFASREQREQAITALDSATRMLPERERRLVDLHYRDSLDLKDVARELRVSYSTCRRYHQAVLERLGKQLRAVGITASPVEE
jgi:RNA polymerase sigma factor for flagellar operon FliA